MSIKRALAAAALAAACLLPSSPAAAQQAGRTLLIIRDYDDTWRLWLALSHAVRLKKAGGEVRVVFQDEAVLVPAYFPLPVPDQAKAPPPDEVPGDFYEEKPFAGHDFSSRTSGKLPLGNRRGRDVRLKAAGRLQYPVEMLNAAFAEFKEAKIPYEVSALCANMFGVLGSLRAKGEPVGPDENYAPDISAQVAAGYKVSVF